MDNWWMNAVWSLTPTVLIGIFFWMVMRLILRADRTERRIYREIEDQEREKAGPAGPRGVAPAFSLQLVQARLLRAATAFPGRGRAWTSSPTGTGPLSVPRSHSSSTWRSESSRCSSCHGTAAQPRVWPGCSRSSCSRFPGSSCSSSSGVTGCLRDREEKQEAINQLVSSLAERENQGLISDIDAMSPRTRERGQARPDARRAADAARQRAPR